MQHKGDKREAEEGGRRGRQKREAEEGGRRGRQKREGLLFAKSTTCGADSHSDRGTVINQKVNRSNLRYTN